jgi:hypothetical protein
MTGRALHLVLASLFLLAACTPQKPGAPQSGAHQHGAPGAAAERPVLYDSLGRHTYRITTASPEAQRWFDQGLRLVYAFNHHEAQKAFREAARLDPACAMCSWGIAVTEGSNYNSPTAADREKAALAAVGRAQQLAGSATPRERALIARFAVMLRAPPALSRQILRIFATTSFITSSAPPPIVPSRQSTKARAAGFSQM